jgi:hypothetical protein
LTPDEWLEKWTEEIPARDEEWTSELLKIYGLTPAE